MFIMRGKWLTGFAAVSIVAAAVGGFICQVSAGESVRFSDSKKPLVLPEAGKKDRSAPFGGLLDRESSLGGVTAVPFSSVYTPSAKSSSKSLSPRERDMLYQRSNWIQRTPDDVGVTEKTASKAFGVREYDLDSVQDQERSRKGDLGRYVDKLDEKEKVRKEKDDRDPEARGRDSSAHLASSQSDKSEKSDASSPAGEKSRSRVTPTLSVGEISTWTRLDDAWFGRAEDKGTKSAGQHDFMDLFRSNPRPLGFSRPQTARSESSKRTGGEGDSESGRSGVGGSLDPVNFHPDLTRQQLNPVVGVVASPAANPAAAPNFSDSLRPMGAAPFSARSGVLDALNIGGVVPSATPTFKAPVESRRPAVAPFVTEVPKRPW